MGTVYLGRSAQGRRVAIKVIRSELASDEAFVRRFHHEVAAARRVAGFCTARVLDAGLDAPRPYLVTEFVDGLRLDHAVERDGPLTDSNLEAFAVGVAAALTAIHSAGVIHRDLKPGNVLLSRFGPRVIDFGIARALDETSVLTRISSIMGTPGWMSPEQFEKRPASPATDVFTWGGLVSFAASGRQPYGEGPLATIAYRVMHEPVDLSAIEEGNLRDLVAAALDKDPSKRPSAREILLDLLGEEAEGNTNEAVTTALQRTWSGPTPVPPGSPLRSPADPPAAGTAAGTPAAGATTAAAATAASAGPGTPTKTSDAAGTGSATPAGSGTRGTAEEEQAAPAGDAPSPADGGPRTPVDAAAAAAAIVSTSALAATAAQAKGTALEKARDAATDSTSALDDGPTRTKPIAGVKAPADRLLPAAGKPLPPGRIPGQDSGSRDRQATARRPDPNRPLPSAGLPMPEAPARGKRQRPARAEGTAPSPTAWGPTPPGANPASMRQGHPGPYAPPDASRQVGHGPEPPNGPYGQAAYDQRAYQRGAPPPERSANHARGGQQAFGGQPGHTYPPGQARQNPPPANWPPPAYPQQRTAPPPVNWQQQQRPQAVPQRPGQPPAHPGGPGAHGPPVQQQPRPSVGYRLRRGFAYLLAWFALGGTLLCYAARSQGTSSETELAGAIGFLFGVFVLAYLVLPRTLRRRGQAITARIIGLIGIASGFLTAASTLAVGDTTAFLDRFAGAYLMLGVGFFLYPKDRAPRPPH
jgi:predicted Ser/Thr protein kinase